MAKAKSTEVATITEDNKNTLIPLDSAPDYLTGEKVTGMEALSGSDFKIPRIKHLQPLTPEITSFPGKAIPGEFWHTGANKSLGNEFNFVPCLISKRVIIWHPDRGVGMLAFSRDGLHWDQGGNQVHEVKIKNVPKPVKWNTGKDVASSKLLDWGTFNPDDPDSGPAATLSYEYLCYLPDYPELSPVVMGLYKTAINNGKQLNTSILMTRRPPQSLLVRCFAEEKHEGENTWHVPKFETQGYIPKELYEICKNIAEKQASYQTTYDQEEAAATPATSDTY